MKPNGNLGGRLSPRQTHGYAVLKRGVRALSTRVVDRRTRIGKALDAWRSELLADLGGRENISTQEAALLEEAVLTKLILASINAWMLEQKSLVSGRNRGVLPVVRDRNALVATLKGLLESLGLKRKAKPVKSLEQIIAEHDAAKAAAQAASGPACAKNDFPEGVTESK
jgi:hypothetical protein